MSVMPWASISGIGAAGRGPWPEWWRSRASARSVTADKLRAHGITTVAEVARLGEPALRGRALAARPIERLRRRLDRPRVADADPGGVPAGCSFDSFASVLQ